MYTYAFDSVGHVYTCIHTEECGNGGMEGVRSEEEIPCWTQGQGACGLSVV